MTASPPLPETMVHVSVTSSSIASAGYCAAARVLEVRFCSGARYRFLEVPAWVHSGLLSACSKGRFFNEAIRGRFPHERS